MNPQEYEEYTHALRDRLASDERVIGLVALGSMADRSRRDEWSDHDFWVITQSGSQEAFLADLAWLPHANEIILAFRQAHSYYTILYRNGHSVEFAIFDIKEMQQGKLDTYALLFDKAELAALITQTRERSLGSTRAYQAGISDADTLNYFFLQLLTAVQRHFRGELLSSQQNINSALNNLLFLIQRHLAPQDARLIDSFDIRRHFERIYPTVADQIHFALSQETPATALGLLSIADTLLAPLIADYPHEVATMLRAKIKDYQALTR